MSRSTHPVRTGRCGWLHLTHENLHTKDTVFGELGACNLAGVR